LPTTSPTAETPPAFPIRTISLGLAAIAALLITSTILTWRVGNQIRYAMDAQAKVVTAAEQVEHYGTVLEMSIKAVVSHGDAEAAARYRLVQPKLRTVLTNLRADVQGRDNEMLAASVDEADRDLIAMEYRALDLVAQGNIVEARRIIDSRRYDYLLNVYYEGVRAIETQAARYAESIRWQLNLNVWLIVAMSAASLVLVILGWIALIIPTRRWGRQLNRARAAAENSARLLQEKQAELERLNGQLFEQARTDSLTGVHTRLRFNEDIADLWPRLARGSARACAMMCDIDHFKLYNDTFGHVAGDDVLRRVAGALDAVRRGGDQLYRMGGEEFLLILHSCTIDQAASRAEDYRAAVERLAIPHSASPLGRVTISVGVAPLGASGRASLQGCLTEADEAMYEAKAQGRNAVVSSARLAA
jgi:diguanylate cyclase (GGDEF)-like protein